MITRVLAIALAVSLSANALLGWGYSESLKTIGAYQVAARKDRDALAAAAATIKQISADSDRAWGDLEAACKTNAAAAMKAGRTIERIVYAPRDPSAPRGLVGAGELRDVVGQSAGAPVPAGREGGELRP
jgi:hypothetical protein